MARLSGMSAIVTGGAKGIGRHYSMALADEGAQVMVADIVDGSDVAGEIDVELWDKVMAVNVRGPFLMAKHVVPHMREKRRGKIINIGSGTAKKGMPNFLHYVTSKGAITSMTRAMSRELGGDGICVNTLAPGLIMSDSVQQSGTHSDTTVNAVVQSRAIKRDAFPEDLLGALVFLASKESDFVSGQIIAVDGGSTNT